MRDLERFHVRRKLRLSTWDYSSPGAYYVTLCTVESGEIFGILEDGHVRLNDAGEIVADAWRWLPTRYPYVTLDEWCVMPDHSHAIIVVFDFGVPASRHSVSSGWTPRVDAGLATHLADTMQTRVVDTGSRDVTTSYAGRTWAASLARSRQCLRRG